MEIILGIFNEFNGKERSYIEACKDIGVNYKLIDIISNDWLNNVISSGCNGFLVRPSGDKDTWKRLYDERLYFVVNTLKFKIYPSYNEILLYENKKIQHYWMSINRISHPKTWIFYCKNEAIKFVENYEKWPIVFKQNVSSVARGVRIVNSKKKALKLINRIFTKYKFYNRGFTRWHRTKKGYIYPLMDDKQYNFIIFQEYIDIKWEWRTLRVGDSYFGHQKLKKGKFHSGSGLVGWVKPPLSLMKFVHNINEIGGFRSMNIDVFEDMNGKFFVNELQTFWGGELFSQMNIDNKPYRYLLVKGEWKLEEGIFNYNKSCNLRVMDFLKILKKNS